MTVKGLTAPNRVGCEFFVCLRRFVGLVRSLLLDWYLGSQKLREILTLLYCITLSSSRENQRSAQEVARRISGAVAGEVYAKVNIPSTHHIPLSPALHYLPFASRFPLPHFTLAFLFALSFSFAFFPYVSLFVFPSAFYMLASSLAENLLIWIHLKCSTWIIFDPYALVLKPQLA